MCRGVADWVATQLSFLFQFSTFIYPFAFCHCRVVYLCCCYKKYITKSNHKNRNPNSVYKIATAKNERSVYIIGRIVLVESEMFFVVLLLLALLMLFAFYLRLQLVKKQNLVDAKLIELHFSQIDRINAFIQSDTNFLISPNIIFLLEKSSLRSYEYILTTPMKSFDLLRTCERKRDFVSSFKIETSPPEISVDRLNSSISYNQKVLKSIHQVRRLLSRSDSVSTLGQAGIVSELLRLDSIETYIRGIDAVSAAKKALLVGNLVLARIELDMSIKQLSAIQLPLAPDSPLKMLINKLSVTVSEQEALKRTLEERERTMDEEEWNIVLGRHKKTYY